VLTDYIIKEKAGLTRFSFFYKNHTAGLAFGLRPREGFLAPSFFGAVFLAGALGAADLGLATWAGLAAGLTSAGAALTTGTSTLYGASAVTSAGLPPNSFLIKLNIVCSSLEIYLH